MGARTVTGGREATTGVVPGRWALSIGDPGSPLPDGWVWKRLTDVARLESGHTPSRRQPAYWDGGIPWIGIKDATSNHGRKLDDTFQHVSELGIEHSSARVLPEGTICLSRTASVGYVVVTGRPMATSQDFVNWICSGQLDQRYLKYILLAETETLRRFAYGTTHTTVYYPEVKAFHIAYPPPTEQRAIASVLGALDDKIESNERLADDQLRMSRAWFEHIAADAPRERLDSMVHLIKEAVQPGASPDDAFEHFSIPAFDKGRTPTLDRGRDLKSGKMGLVGGEVSVLLSKLNPNHAWRSWWAVPSGAGKAVCSPEFIALTPKTVAPEWLFASVAWDSRFRRDVLSGLSGTTGSRQRVKQSDVAAAGAPVFKRRVADDWLAFARPAFAQVEHLRVESGRLAAIRDALLPRLVSGRIRAPLTNDPEEAVETVLGAL